MCLFTFALAADCEYIQLAVTYYYHNNNYNNDNNNNDNEYITAGCMYS